MNSVYSHKAQRRAQQSAGSVSGFTLLLQQSKLIMSQQRKRKLSPPRPLLFPTNNNLGWLGLLLRPTEDMRLPLVVGSCLRPLRK